MAYYYGSMRRVISGVESTIATPPTAGFQDWCTNFQYRAQRTTQNIEEYSGATNGITDIVELNHYWELTFTQYLRYQGLGVNALACILGGGDTKSGGSSPYTHVLGLSNSGNGVKTKSLWVDDGSGAVQWFPSATTKSWKLDWNTTNDANKVEIMLDSFAPINGTGAYTPPFYPNLTSVNSQNAGRAGRAVNVEYQIYSGAGAAWTGTPESGEITISRPSQPFWGQGFNSAGPSGISPFLSPSDLLTMSAPSSDPLNPVAIVTGPAAVSGQFQAVFGGNSGSNPYNDYLNFRELIGTSATQAAPGGAPTLAQGAATGGSYPDSGAHTYAFTYLTPQGETLIGTTAATTGAVSDGAHKVTVSNITTGGVGCIGRRIYRSKVGTTTPLYLAGTILDNVTTTFADAKTDAQLSTAVSPATGTATYLPTHRLIFYDQAELYYLELDLGPMRLGDVNVDGTQHPIRITLPFTVYSDLGSASIGNDGISYNNLVSAVVSSPYSSAIF